MKSVIGLIRIMAWGILFSVVVFNANLRADLQPFLDTFSDGVLDNFWTTFSTISGSQIRETGGKLQITVPTAPSDWKDAGIRSKETFGLQDFECSVDFRVPEGNSMAWLSAAVYPDNGRDTGFWCAYYFGEDYYVWFRNKVDGGYVWAMPAFGDENSKWHTFKLVYDADTMNASAFVDNIFPNSRIVDLTNFRISVSTKAGSYVSAPSTVEFDNFQITPEPTTLLLLTLGGLALTRHRR